MRPRTDALHGQEGLTVPTKRHIARLQALGACSEAGAFAAGFPSLRAAWQACPRPDWLLWYAGRANVSRRTLTLVACACARDALKHVAPGEGRPLAAIEAAEQWARREGVTLEQVRKAAANATAYAANVTANAANAANAAANAAYAAATAAASAAYAAATADDDADDAADAYAYDEPRRRLCDIIRQTWPVPPRVRPKQTKEND